MKKISKALLFIAVPAMAAVSCAKENIDIASTEGVTVHFSTAELSTKSHFGDKAEDGKYPTLWTVGQTVAIIYNGSNTSTPSKIDVTPSADFKTASFAKEFEMSSTVSSHNFYIASPGEAAIGFPNGNYNLQIPTTQTPLDGSCDEAAQITVANHVSETFDTEINGLQFSHVTAYGRMSVVLPEDAGEVSSIALTASKNIAGRWFYSFEDGSLKENSASATITLNTSKTSDVFFGCAPADLAGGTLAVVVTAANGTYEKTIDFTSAAKPLKFEAGKVSAFGVTDFTKKATDEVYTLVTDASTLKIGDKVIIAAAASGYAISTTQNNNNRAQTSITKTGNTIVNPGKDVQLFTLEAGSTDGTYAFNTGSGYIYAAGTISGKNKNNYLKTQNTKDANSSWKVECTDKGVATIIAQGTNKCNILSYNENNDIFSCYNSTTQSAIAIYTDGKGTGSLPTPPSIVLSSTEVSLAYDDETTHEDITATVSGQEGDIECAAYDDKAGTTESSWLIASYENGKVVYSAIGKNETDSPRTAYIIISASNSDGTTTKVITVMQKQSGSVEELSTIEITISAFGKSWSSYADKTGTVAGSDGISYGVKGVSICYNEDYIQARKSKDSKIYNTTSLGKIKSIKIKDSTNATFTVKVGNSSNSCDTEIASSDGRVFTNDNLSVGYFTIENSNATIANITSVTITYAK